MVRLILFYQRWISPLFPPSCRFYPSCSNYAVTAFRVHGGIKGSWLTTKRLCRCHPFCAGGYDPVPGTDSGDISTDTSQRSAEELNWQDTSKSNATDKQKS